MIVTRENFDETIETIGRWQVMAVDCETTGLRVHHGDRLFSVILHNGKQGFYFNFNHDNENDRLAGVTPLPKEWIPRLQDCFHPMQTVVAANAKFDMHMLANEGIYIFGKVWDVLVMARLENNSFMTYSLGDCAARIGKQKSNVVDEYIKKYRCYVKTKIPGKKGEHKNPCFWMVPLPTISEYGLMDGKIAMDLFEHQVQYFTYFAARGGESIWKIVENECALTKVCFEIERRGMLLDVDYVKRAMDHESQRAKNEALKFKAITGHELIDSYVNLKKAFEPLGIEGAVTEKGNPSFTDEVLSNVDHPAAKALLSFRDANKRASTYYSAFLFHKDSQDVVHCNIRQSATATGRFSITDPALQTLTAEDEGEWLVRRSFKPRPGFCLVAIDYKAFEFRAMLDTAGQKDLADAILNGLDPHQATADLVGISRKQAKTLNFGLLYGMGAGKLAHSLGVPLDEAKKIKSQYFEKLPEIKKLIYFSTAMAEKHQFVRNRFGRPYRFPDSKFAYKALNALIQGGTAEAVKFAMVKINHGLQFSLEPVKSGILLQVHDEILFEVHKDELHLIEFFKKTMEEAWPSKFHPMECSVDHSWESWGDLVEGVPNG